MKAPLQLGLVARFDVLLDRARAAAKEQRWADAIAIGRRILAADPTNLDAINELAAAHNAQGDLGLALKYTEDSLRIDPTQLGKWLDRGMLARKIGNLDLALLCFDEMLRLKPGLLYALERRAETLHLLGRFEEAAAMFGELAKSAPHNLAPFAEALSWCGQAADALAVYDQAIALPAVSGPATGNKALFLMRLGDLPNGLRLFDKRWEILLGPDHKTESDRPHWRGETDIAGKRLFIRWEQGFGDTIQFCRYATLAAKAGARVILRVQNPLLRLMRTLEGVEQLLGEDDPLPDHDLQCQMMSLPLAMGTTIDTIPAAVPYLHPDPADVPVWAARLAPIEGKKIGLVWAGQTRPGHVIYSATDRRRSIALSALAPLAGIPGCEFVSLQLGPPAAQAAQPPAGMVLHDHTADLRDFADTAALIQNLDLVIGVDTATIHLAAALGKPVFLLNRFDTCWRWFTGRSDSPWYPGMRIFRQPRSGDWQPVINEAAEALRAFAASPAPQ